MANQELPLNLVTERLDILEEAMRTHVEIRESQHLENKISLIRHEEKLDRIIDFVDRASKTIWGNGDGKLGHETRLDRIEQILKLEAWILGTVAFIFFGLACQELWIRFIKGG